MDLATKLFSLSFGVEPNKATLKDFSDILNSAVLSLSDKQKALSQYADTAQTQTYVAAANANGSGPVQQVQKRPAKPQVKWAIPEEKMKELLWKRAQLLQFERAKAAREKTSQANGKTKPRGPPPKLGKPKNGSEKGAQGQANGVKPKAPQTKPSPSKPSPTQAPKTPDTPKSKPASNQAAKPKSKPAPINTKPQQGQPGKAINGKPAAKSK